MNFSRLIIVIPLYIVIVGTLEQSQFAQYILTIPFKTTQLWSIELVALLIGVGGSYLFHRPNGWLTRRPSIFFFVLAHGLLGLAFSAGFGIYSLITDGYPYLPGLISIPLAFALSELLYIVVMREWAKRKARQNDWMDD